MRGGTAQTLVNRDENRLIYIRQSAPGIGEENAAFSVPEIQDLHASVKNPERFGDFSAMNFTMIGLGEPRSIQVALSAGTYFDVMGLHPVLGRLIGPQDDGLKLPAVVSPTVSGRTLFTKILRSSAKPFAWVASVIALQQSLASSNLASISARYRTYFQCGHQPHHLSATMVTGRIHRMTEVFGRLAPGATLDQARAELSSVYSAMKKDHPEAYAQEADFQIGGEVLRDQITSGRPDRAAGAAGSVRAGLIIACSNVANLILARTVRREGDWRSASRSAQAEGHCARMLLAESLLLWCAGAALGVLSAQPMVAVLARYASRFSIRALDFRVDSSLLWVGAGLAIVAAADTRLRSAPALFSGTSGTGSGLSLSNSSGSARITGSHQPPPADFRGDTNRRVFRVAGRASTLSLR